MINSLNSLKSINPILEFYEYQIHNYKPYDRFNNFEKDRDTVFKFGNIKDTYENQCSRIAIEGSYNELNESKNDTQRATCDPISSDDNLDNLSGGNYKINHYSTYDIENLYPNYKEFFAKYEAVDVLNERSIKKIFDNLDKAIQNQYNLLINMTTDDELLKKNKEIYLKNIMTNKDLQNLKEQNINDSILIRLDITKKNKIVMFGDFHGSFHTFFRLLCRLHRYDILNLDTFEIKDSYKIIFLGDILDRGKYALDIIYIIIRLIVVNNINKDNIKIIYNRGNHETSNIFERDGFYEEVKTKFNNDINNIDTFFIKYIKLLNLLPSAVLLNCEDTLIWCSHGGFPRRFINERLSDKRLQIFKNNDSTDIRWSDFGGVSDSTNKEDHIQSTRGNDIVKYTIHGATKFLKNNNIKFIIRGHQDSNGNSFLFDKEGFVNIISDPKMIDIDNFLYYNNPSLSNTKYGYRVEGAIARLKLDNINNNFFPIITISTNTDTRRYLNSDSFALLRFDIDIDINTDNLKNFANCLKINFINKINTVLNNKKINKSSMFIENLQIIIQILNLIDSNTFYYFYQNKQLDITFITNMFQDCIEFCKYYEQKYNNLSTKIKILIDNNRIESSQIIYIRKYINSYEAKIKETYKKIDKINIQTQTNQDYKSDKVFTDIDLENLKKEIIKKFNEFNEFNDK